MGKPKKLKKVKLEPRDEEDLAADNVEAAAVAADVFFSVKAEPMTVDESAQLPPIPCTNEPAAAPVEEDELEEGEIVDSSEESEPEPVEIVKVVPPVRKRRHAASPTTGEKEMRLNGQVNVKSEVFPNVNAESIPYNRPPPQPLNPILEKQSTDNIVAPVIPHPPVLQRCYGYFIPKEKPSYDELQKFYMQSLATAANPLCPAAQHALPSMVGYSYQMSETYNNLHRKQQQAETQPQNNQN